MSHQGSWDGYTNLDENDEDVQARIADGYTYYGDMADYRGLYDRLEDALEQCSREVYGVEAPVEIKTMSTNDPETDWQSGFPYGTDGLNIEDAASAVEMRKYNGCTVYELKHCSLAPPFISLSDVIQKYDELSEGEIMGVNSHCNDFAEYGEGEPRGKIEGWFEFLAGRGAAVKTVSQITAERVTGVNYIDLEIAPSDTVPGGVVTLSWACDFSIWDYQGVPADIYLAVVRSPVVSDAPSSVSDALAGGSVYLWGPGMRSFYQYEGLLQGPAFSNVSFPPASTSGSMNISVPADAVFAGDYAFATAFIWRDTGRFVREDGLPMENSPLFTVR